MSAGKKLSQDPWVQLLAFLCLVSGVMTAHGLRLSRGLSPAGLWPGAPGGGAASRRLSGPKTPGRWVVDAKSAADADTDSVADAVASAEEGDSVLIRPGDYAGSLVLDKSLSLAGSGRSPEEVILRGSSSATLTAAGGSSALSNLSLVNEGPPGSAALVVDGSSLALTGVRLRSRADARGAVVTGGSLTASGTEFETAGEALIVEAGGSLRLSSCAVSGAGTAVQATGAGTRAVLLSTRLSRNRDGVSALDRAKVELSGSRLSENSARALAADFGAEISDFGSVIAGGKDAAVSAAGRATVRLDQTQIAGGSSGIALSGGAMLILNRGKVSDASGPGISVSEGSELHLSGSEVSGSRGCGLEIAASSAFLDSARVNRNDCGVAFRGRGRLQSNDGDFTGNSRGAFLYSKAFVSGIYLHGTGNAPADFQAYFR